MGHEQQNIYGLFIGVNRYESEDIRPLAFASADVLPLLSRRRYRRPQRPTAHLRNPKMNDNLKKRLHDAVDAKRSVS